MLQTHTFVYFIITFVAFWPWF